MSIELGEHNFSDYLLDELFEKYEIIKSAWIKFDQYNVLPWFVGGDYFGSYLKNELSNIGLSDEETTILLTPAKPSFSAEEELQILGLSLEAVENKLNTPVLPEYFLKKIDDLVLKYYWVPFGLDGPTVYNRDHYIKTIKEIIDTKNKDEIKDKITQIKNYEYDINKKQEAIKIKYKITKELSRQTEVLHILTLMTDERKDYEFHSHVAFYKILEEIGNKIGIENVQFIKHITLEELKKFRNDSKKLNDIGKSRMDGYLMFHFHHSDGQYDMTEGTEAQKIAEQIIPKLEKTKIIKGVVACKGKNAKTTGIVKILMFPKEIVKLKQGEIIVTPMTTPEYVPAMRKSVAIITDEGGITCHAAIVSRELNIPCIIGTKNASKILKDGDLIEVDTDSGIIKIL